MVDLSAWLEIVALAHDLIVWTQALALDGESLIQESLERLRGSLTVFIVAHCISTLDSCERVLVLLEGRVDAFDSSDRLHTASEYYRTTRAMAGMVAPAGAAAQAGSPIR